MGRIGPVPSFGVNRKATRRQVETAVTPMLTKGEHLQRSGPAWAVEHRGKAPLLFRERDLHEVVLTDQRLILLTRPRRRRPLGVNNLVLAKRYTTFSLERARRLRPMLQLRVRTSADRVLVLEFRPRDRRVARDLADAVGPSSSGPPETGSAHPVAPEPAAPEAVTPGPAAAEPVRFEPPPPEGPVAPEKPSRKEQRRAGKESKRAAKEQTRAGEDAPERRDRPDRRKRSDGPPGGFERRSGRDRRSGWGDAKPSRKQRRQARQNKKQRDAASDGDDIIDLLSP